MSRKLKLPEVFSENVEIKKVNMDVVKGWIDEQVQKSLPDDEFVSDYLLELLQKDETPNPESVFLDIKEFFSDDGVAMKLMKRLWELLVDAQTDKDGIPKLLIDKKIEVLKKDLLEKRQKKDAPRDSQGRQDHRRQDHGDLEYRSLEYRSLEYGGLEYRSMGYRDLEYRGLGYRDHGYRDHGYRDQGYRTQRGPQDPREKDTRSRDPRDQRHLGERRTRERDYNGTGYQNTSKTDSYDRKDTYRDDINRF